MLSFQIGEKNIWKILKMYAQQLLLIWHSTWGLEGLTLKNGPLSVKKCVTKNGIKLV